MYKRQVVLGINSDGLKEVLTIEVGENESAKYWLSVLNGLKNRGVKDILLLCAEMCIRDSMKGAPVHYWPAYIALLAESMTVINYRQPFFWMILAYASIKSASHNYGGGS